MSPQRIIPESIYFLNTENNPLTYSPQRSILSIVAAREQTINEGDTTMQTWTIQAAHMDTSEAEWYALSYDAVYGIDTAHYWAAMIAEYGIECVQYEYHR
jgi:hypothetical protein